MSRQSYINGFCKQAAARGVDPRALWDFMDAMAASHQTKQAQVPNVPAQGVSPTPPSGVTSSAPEKKTMTDDQMRQLATGAVEMSGAAAYAPFIPASAAYSNYLKSDPGANLGSPKLARLFPWLMAIPTTGLATDGVRRISQAVKTRDAKDRALNAARN